MPEKSYTRSLGEGEKEKIELNLDYSEALTIADDDININWGLFVPELKSWR